MRGERTLDTFWALTLLEAGFFAPDLEAASGLVTADFSAAAWPDLALAATFDLGFGAGSDRADVVELEAACRVTSFMAPAAICWNCCVSAPQSCMGSITEDGVF
jgi:hypothetical protein